MPVIVLNKQFDNQNGDVTSYLRANTGDKITATIDFQSSILVQSSNANYIYNDPVQNIIYWASGSFEDEGFRFGDDVRIKVFTSTGSLIYNDLVTVTSVSDGALYVDDIPHWYDQTDGQIVQISVDTSAGRKREGLILDVNLVPNGQDGNEFSLIDSEVNRLLFNLLELPSGGTADGIIIGNKSGGAIESCQIEDITPMGMTDAYQYRVSVVFYMWSIYDESDFATADCLKFYAKSKWQSYFGEPFSNTELIVNDDADTGWFNQAFNQGIVDAELVQSISEMAYDVTSTGTAIIESASDIVGFGACYIPSDETYYKNKVLGMQDYAFMGPTEYVAAYPQARSINGVNGAAYNLTLNRTVDGTTQTFDVELHGNTAFKNFFAGRAVGDRRFVIWVKVGNLNLTVFDGQLTSNPPVAGPFDFVETKVLNHGQNVQTIPAGLSSISANIEDDLCFVGGFQAVLGEAMTSITAEVRAYNLDTDEFFSLQSVVFDIASVPIVGGRHVLNLSQSVFSSLPTTSAKRNALLVLDSTYDDYPSNLYGVRLALPYLYRWETWLQQLNANNDFYPNKDKNWLQYGTTGSWVLQLNIELIKDNLQYVFNENLEIKDYDSQPLLDNDVKLYYPEFNESLPESNVITALPENTIVEIVTTHAINNGSAWITGEIWGMITIEPTQSSPRWISSTVIDFDNNISNPLTPIAGLTKCEISFPVENVARLRCLLDTSKIDITNGVKITSKIYGNV